MALRVFRAAVKIKLENVHVSPLRATAMHYQQSFIPQNEFLMRISPKEDLMVEEGRC